MICPACGQPLPPLGQRFVVPKTDLLAVVRHVLDEVPEFAPLQLIEVCDRWCAYTMHEEWKDDR